MAHDAHADRRDKLPSMAQEWLRFLHPLCGRIGKVLVTDLDNTLWGGVIGEDGMDGIKLSREYPGRLAIVPCSVCCWT